MTKKIEAMMIDVRIRNEGTVWSFEPVSDEAKSWFEENVRSEPWQWLGPSLVVDHRYAEPLIEGLFDAGFDLE